MSLTIILKVQNLICGYSAVIAVCNCPPIFMMLILPVWRYKRSILHTLMHNTITSRMWIYNTCWTCGACWLLKEPHIYDNYTHTGFKHYTKFISRSHIEFPHYRSPLRSRYSHSISLIFSWNFCLFIECKSIESGIWLWIYLLYVTGMLVSFCSIVWYCFLLDQRRWFCTGRAGDICQNKCHKK